MSSPLPSDQKMRVLWIDGEPGALKNLTRIMVDELDVEVKFASTLSSALRELRSSNYRLLIQELHIDIGNDRTLVSEFGSFTEHEEFIGIDFIFKFRQGRWHQNLARESTTRPDVPIVIFTADDCGAISAYILHRLGDFSVNPIYCLEKNTDKETFLKTVRLILDIYGLV